MPCQVGLGRTNFLTLISFHYNGALLFKVHELARHARELALRRTVKAAMTEHLHDHPHDHAHGHGHSHGMIDPSIASSERGLWAVKWSFIGLAATALLQLFVVLLSGSVALLADTIHNIGDAATAIPLAIAFWFARRKPSRRFTFGYSRVEDLAGIAVVLTILASAIIAGMKAFSGC